MYRYICLLLTAIFIFCQPVAAMNGCGEGSCADCHNLSIDEAKHILGRQVRKVNSVSFSTVPGLWLLQVEHGGQEYPLYLDFSKKYVAEGNIFRLVEGKTISKPRLQRNQLKKKIDISSISLEDALLLGDKNATIKAFVVTDPDCPFCKRFHKELKKIVDLRKDIAFYIKLFPLKIHPQSRRKAESIICAKSIELFEKSLDGKNIPDPNCKNDFVERNIKFFNEHNIHSTPTLILPDGTVAPGFSKADQLIILIDKHRVEPSK